MLNRRRIPQYALAGLTLVAVSVASSGLYGQQPISATSAENVANRFMRRAGLTAAPAARIVRNPDHPYTQLGAWDVGLSNGVFVGVDAATGQVVKVSNQRRYSARARGGVPKDQMLLSTPAKAENYLRQLGTRLGVPAHYRFEKSQLKLDNDRKIIGNRQHGVASAGFREYYKGRLITMPFNEVIINVDPLDGTLLYYLKRGGVRVVADKLVVSQANAQTTAHAAVRGITRLSPTPLKKSPVLVYVTPNGMGRNIPFKAPFSARLAWEFAYSGGQHVYVDAGDGKPIAYYPRRVEQPPRAAGTPTP